MARRQGVARSAPAAPRTRALSFAVASCCIVGSVWLRVSSVRVRLACPSCWPTTFGLTAAAKSNVAHEGDRVGSSPGTTAGLTLSPLLTRPGPAARESPAASRPDRISPQEPGGCRPSRRRLLNPWPRRPASEGQLAAHGVSAAGDAAALVARSSPRGPDGAYPGPIAPSPPSGRVGIGGRLSSLRADDRICS